MKVGKIVPHTFVPPLFFLGTRIVKEKKGVQFSLWRENPDENPDFRIFLGVSNNVFENPGLHIVPPNFLWGYNVCHVSGYNV